MRDRTAHTPHAHTRTYTHTHSYTHNPSPLHILPPPPTCLPTCSRVRPAASSASSFLLSVRTRDDWRRASRSCPPTAHAGCTTVLQLHSMLTDVAALVVCVCPRLCSTRSPPSSAAPAQPRCSSADTPIRQIILAADTLPPSLLSFVRPPSLDTIDLPPAFQR
jgi:hypothetical protein